MSVFENYCKTRLGEKKASELFARERDCSEFLTIFDFRYTNRAILQLSEYRMKVKEANPYVLLIPSFVLMASSNKDFLFVDEPVVILKSDLSVLKNLVHAAITEKTKSATGCFIEEATLLHIKSLGITTPDEAMKLNWWLDRYLSADHHIKVISPEFDVSLREQAELKEIVDQQGPAPKRYSL